MRRRMQTSCKKPHNTDKLVYLMRLEEPNVTISFLHFIKNVENQSGML